jgi:PhnB protein
LFIDKRVNMQMNPYLSFKGDCEAAFRFYEQTLGAELGSIFRYGGSPMAGDVPADWSDKVMHGSVTLGGQVLMGGDVAPDQYEAPKGFSLSLQIKNTAEAERIFPKLADGGRVVLPLAKTFWAERLVWSSIASAYLGCSTARAPTNELNDSITLSAAADARFVSAQLANIRLQPSAAGAIMGRG